MLKKIIVNVLLMTIAIAFLTKMSVSSAHKIGLNLSIKMHGDQGIRQIKQTIIVDENIPMTVEGDTFVAHVMMVVCDDKVSVETKVFEKNDQQEPVLVSSPVILVEFGKVGWVRLGKKVDDQDIDSLTVEVRPFRVEK